MIVTNERIVYFDVDSTLILYQDDLHHAVCIYPSAIDIKIEGVYGYNTVVPHYEHIDKLKYYKAKNHTIVVWSAAGAEWAAAVVEALGLKDYVDIAATKPERFYDDLPASAFMDESRRQYIKFKEE